METAHSFPFDETPTPTRFIRNCEEIGLFHDLQHNPFDETFRIATESSPTDFPSLLKGSSSKQISEEPLNTPQVISVSKTDAYQNIYSIVEEDEFILPESFLIEPDSSSISVENEIQSDDSNDVEIIEEPLSNDFINDDAEEEADDDNTKDSLNVSTTVSSLLTNVNGNSITYTLNNSSLKNKNIGSIIFQPGSTSSLGTNILSGNMNKQFIIQKSVIINKNETKATPNVNTSSLQKTVKTTHSPDFLHKVCDTKLPAVISGKNVVILPSRTTNVERTQGTQSNNISQKREIQVKQFSQIDVKQKLKNLLRSSASRMILDADDKEEYSRTSRESSSSNDTSVLDEKKEYSRERNRMAQKRCRLKKKRWIMQLKKETECVLDENQNLQVEVSSLRAEIAHLKTLLLAHRNCSVTRAMFKADLSAIMDKDISQIAEDIEIHFADSTDDCDLTKMKLGNVKSIVATRQQINQLNQQVNHYHVHVPQSRNSVEDVLESICGSSADRGAAKNQNRAIRPSALRRSVKIDYSKYNQTNQSKKLIFDSKVVSIKPDDRSANNLLQKFNVPRVNTSNMKVVSSMAGRRGGVKRLNNVVIEHSSKRPEISGSSTINGDHSVAKYIKLNATVPLSRVDRVNL